MSDKRFLQPPQPNHPLLPLARNPMSETQQIPVQVVGIQPPQQQQQIQLPPPPSQQQIQQQENYAAMYAPSAVLQSGLITNGVPAIVGSGIIIQPNINNQQQQQQQQQQIMPPSVVGQVPLPGQVQVIQGGQVIQQGIQGMARGTNLLIHQTQQMPQLGGVLAAASAATTIVSTRGRGRGRGRGGMSVSNAIQQQKLSGLATNVITEKATQQVPIIPANGDWKPLPPLQVPGRQLKMPRAYYNTTGKAYFELHPHVYDILNTHSSADRNEVLRLIQEKISAPERVSLPFPSFDHKGGRKPHPCVMLTGEGIRAFCNLADIPSQCTTPAVKATVAALADAAKEDNLVESLKRAATMPVIACAMGLSFQRAMCKGRLPVKKTASSYVKKSKYASDDEDEEEAASTTSEEEEELEEEEEEESPKLESDDEEEPTLDEEDEKEIEKAASASTSTTANGPPIKRRHRPSISPEKEKEVEIEIGKLRSDVGELSRMLGEICDEVNTMRSTYQIFEPLVAKKLAAVTAEKQRLEIEAANAAKIKAEEEEKERIANNEEDDDPNAEIENEEEDDDDEPINEEDLIDDDEGRLKRKRSAMASSTSQSGIHPPVLPRSSVVDRLPPKPRTATVIGTEKYGIISSPTTANNNNVPNQQVALNAQLQITQKQQQQQQQQLTQAAPIQIPDGQPVSIISSSTLPQQQQQQQKQTQPPLQPPQVPPAHIAELEQQIAHLRAQHQQSGFNL